MASSRSQHAHGRSELWSDPKLVAAVEREQLRVGRRLRSLRRERSLTQTVAAERAGLHAVQISRIEAGAINPTLATLTALATAYGVELVELFADSRPTQVESARKTPRSAKRA